MAPTARRGPRDPDSSGRSRRALLLYLLAIVGPTVVLLGLGLQAVLRQRHAVDQLSDANRRLRETAIADALERRVQAAAQAALSDPALDRVERGEWSDPRAVADWRRSLAVWRRDHPMVQQLFVVEGSDVRLPRAEPPLPRSAASLAAVEPEGTRARIRRMIADAEGLEHAGDDRRASALYGALHDRATSGPVRAWALARLAVCLSDTRDRERKAQVWSMVAQRYRDEYDTNGRPLALVAGVELARLQDAAVLDYGDVIDAVRREFAEGRWPLTPEEAEYFSTGLDLQGQALADRFASELRLASDLRAHFRHQGTVPAAGEPQAMTLPGGVSLLYTSREGSSGSLVIGLAVNDGWARHDALPRAAAEIAGDTAGGVQLVRTGAGGTPLRSTLPALAVLVPEPLSSRTWAEPDVLLFGSTTVLVLGVLVLGVVLLVRDVGRQAATSQLRANLVGGVSHELKTPLSVIRMYAETLADDPEPGIPERRSYYEVIVQESVRLSHLIERVLDFSRVERGERHYTMRVGDLASVVTRVAAQYAPYVRQQGFTLETAVEHLPSVRMDEEAVSQGVIALVENALKYDADDRFLRIAAYARGNGAVVEVEDRGPGIPPEERERIFGRFYRGSTRSGRGGYGLGLYLVRQTMEAHAGHVEVESEPHQGSRFRLVFPASPTPS